MKNTKKKPDRWEFLNELDGRPTDTTPVRSLYRRPRIRKNARYPVIRFSVDGTIYFAYGQKPTHPSTEGNEVWVRYNIQDPTDNFVASDSNPKLSVGLTLVTAFLGVVLLIMELN